MKLRLIHKFAILLALALATGPAKQVFGAEEEILTIELFIEDLGWSLSALIKMTNNTDQTLCIAENATGSVAGVALPMLEIQDADGNLLPSGHRPAPRPSALKYVHIEPGDAAIVGGDITELYGFRLGKHTYRGRYFLPEYQFSKVCGDASADFTTDWVEFEYLKIIP